MDVEGFRCHTEEGGTTIFCVREGKGEPELLSIPSSQLWFEGVEFGR